jgi:hypothetical protein
MTDMAHNYPSPPSNDNVKSDKPAPIVGMRPVPKADETPKVADTLNQPKTSGWVTGSGV